MATTRIAHPWQTCSFLGIGLWLIGSIALVLILPVAKAQEPEIEADKAAEVRRPLPGRFVEEVLIPVPGEVFSVLEKLGAPDWKQYQETRELPMVAERDRLALLFGVAVAEGFLAVEAEDSAGVEQIGQQVMRLATGLGLRGPVEGHAAAILEGARTQDWKSVRQEFDRAEVTVRDTLGRMKDEPLAGLVSVGGWLRGTQASTAIIKDDYSADAAELLAQGHVLEHFLNKLPEGGAIMPQVQAGLQDIATKVAVEPGDPISLGSVESIHTTCSDLLAIIAGWKIDAN